MSDPRSARKAATHDAIRRAAIDLFEARGFDETTASEIAAAAGVSERTFFRHFPTKVDVAFGGHRERLEVLRRALAERPGDEPVMASVRAALDSLAGEFEAGRGDLVRLQPVVAGSPDLTARAVELQADFADAVRLHVADRLGLDADVDLLPNLVGQAVTGAVMASVTTWMATGAGGDLAALVQEALRALDEGLGRVSRRP